MPNSEHIPSLSNVTDHYYELHAYDLIDPPSRVVAILEFIGAALGLAAVCRFFRFLRCCCSPRRRADCAARREERRTRRAYRRAERAHRCAERKRQWKEWWGEMWKRKQHPTDYEEKRALILEQEGRLEAAMQEEIRRLEEGYKEDEDGSSTTMQDELRQLRNAHEVVNDLVHAEQARIYATQSHSYHARRHSGASRMSRTSSLPSYSTEPPVYTPRYVSSSEDEEVYSIGTDSSSDAESDFVARAGFVRFTPSTSTGVQIWTPPQSGSDSAPLSPVGSAPPSVVGSSIIDVSPRDSGETLRTATTGRAASPRFE